LSVVVFRSVHYSYPLSNQEALSGVDLSISEGERVAILGENGAGKTTLLKHMNGLLRPTKGFVEIEGVDTRKAKTYEIARKVGMVFQNPNHQFFAQTCWDEVAFALRNFGYAEEEIAKRTEAALRDFGLWEYKDESPFLLSSGEKKRLSIASVMVYDPSVLVLDEPTAGQDAGQKRRIGEMLSTFKGKAVIVSTHDMEFAVKHFPRTIIISRGRVVVDGPTREVFYGEYWASAGLLEPQVVALAKALGMTAKPITAQEFVKAFEEAVAK